MPDHNIRGDCMADMLWQRFHARFIAEVARGSCRHTGIAHQWALAGVLMFPLLLMLSWSTGGCSVASTDADAQPPGVEELDGRFRKLAFEQLTFKLEKNSPLPPPAQRAIEEFIAAGARRLSTDGATPENISTAEVNLNRFVSGLSEAADVGELDDISAETVTATRNRLCPLYPFC
jgi:hypothetical protein